MFNACFSLANIFDRVWEVVRLHRYEVNLNYQRKHIVLAKSRSNALREVIEKRWPWIQLDNGKLMVVTAWEPTDNPRRWFVSVRTGFVGAEGSMKNERPLCIATVEEL